MYTKSRIKIKAENAVRWTLTIEQNPASTGIVTQAEIEYYEQHGFEPNEEELRQFLTAKR